MSPQHPRFVITTGSVTCPDTISAGQTAQCVAYFYDENHVLVSPVTPTWSSSAVGHLSVSSSGVITGISVGWDTVYATASGVRGAKAVYVKPGLSVTINGHSTVRRGDTCIWTSTVSGGTAPYSYSWSDEGSGSSGSTTGTSFTVTIIGAGDYIYLTVTDINGVQKSVTKYVSATLSAPLC